MFSETIAEQLSVNGFEVVATRPVDDAPDDATSLVLINGLGAGPKHWGPVLEKLAQRRPVYAVEAVSQDDDGLMSTSADNVVGIADALGLEEFYLGGQSWGSLAAQKAAIRHERRVKKLFLVATAPGTPVVPPRYSALMAISSDKRNLDDAGKIFGGEVTRIMQDDPGDLSPEDQVTRSLITELMNREIDPRKVRNQQRKALNNSRSGWFNLIGLAGLVDTPTLIVAGDQDPLTRPFNARAMKAIMPNTELHIEEGVGHDVILSRADSVAARANIFFDSEPEPVSVATAALGLWLRSASNFADVAVQMLPGL
jgi:pimeloyl-ACP methyl ester carboxylesterase